MQDRPIERSARKRPPQAQSTGPRKKVRSVDPRFDPLYGSFSGNEYSEQYRFVRELKEKEHDDRVKRVQLLRLALRRLDAEVDGDSDACHVISEQEEDIDDSADKQLLEQFKRTSARQLRNEIANATQEIARFKSQRGDAHARQKKDAVFREAVKSEFKAVKEGKKTRAFLPKRKLLLRRDHM